MDLEGVTETQDLNQWLRDNHMQGYWDRDEAASQFKPYLWKWDPLYRGMLKATEVVPMEQAFRRNIGLRNPSLGQQSGTNLALGMQCILPGEFAKAHRHSASAIRFIVKGSPDAFSVAEGEALPMEEGDLLTNPHWTWHDHFNNSDQPVMWLDGLDVRLAALAKQFREDYPAGQQPQDKPTGYSAKLLGHVKPASGKSEHQTPPFRYPWADTYAALMAMKQSEVDADPYDGYHLMYTHPLTGGPTLPTFACEIQLFTPRQKAKEHRPNSTTFYHVFRGQGVTTIDGERFEWSQGDVFVIPPWASHQHENLGMQDAILFSICDWPAITALGLYQTEEGRTLAAARPTVETAG